MKQTQWKRTAIPELPWVQVKVYLTSANRQAIVVWEGLTEEEYRHSPGPAVYHRLPIRYYSSQKGVTKRLNAIKVKYSVDFSTGDLCLLGVL